MTQYCRRSRPLLKLVALKVFNGWRRVGMVQIASCKVLKDCYMQRGPDFRFHRREGTTNLSLHLHGNLTSTRALSTEVSELVRLPRVIASAPRDCHTEKPNTSKS